MTASTMKPCMMSVIAMAFQQLGKFFESSFLSFMELHKKSEVTN